MTFYLFLYTAWTLVVVRYAAGVFMHRCVFFSFKAQLAEANAKISRLYSDPTAERYVASDKKNTYHHDKQLEELRNLQVRSQRLWCNVRRVVDMF